MTRGERQGEDMISNLFGHRKKEQMTDCQPA